MPDYEQTGEEVMANMQTLVNYILLFKYVKAKQNPC